MKENRRTTAAFAARGLVVVLLPPNGERRSANPCRCLALSYVAGNREGREREDRSHCSPEERTREVGRAHGIQMTSPGSRCRRQNRVSSLEIVAATKRHPLPGRRGEKSPLSTSQLPSSRIVIGELASASCRRRRRDRC
nr:hypothetical protein Iba_chr08eCG5860 [Ipomoea batatas]